MIQLQNNTLVFTFPEVHPDARLEVEFQRTLRIPDDGSEYPLPPGFGPFSLVHVDDYAERVPKAWLDHGGVMFPMYQSEAMWINFRSFWIDTRRANYPFAVRVATGKICAVSGEQWSPGLTAEQQNYVVVPDQPWLDGYVVERNTIRQFVAMPLGDGYTAEEQLTGTAEYGGIQIQVYPMKRDEFEQRFPIRTGPNAPYMETMVPEALVYEVASPAPDMGLAPGGRMYQQVYQDPYPISVWDASATSRCFAHIANSLAWRALTGQAPPTIPPTASDYTDAGLPWFQWYTDDPVTEGSPELAGLKSVTEKAAETDEHPLPENQSTTTPVVINLREGLGPNQVREW